MKMIKKVFLAFIALAATVGLVACGSGIKAEDAVAEAKKSLTLSDITSLTTGFTLSAEKVKYGVEVSWESNNTTNVTVEKVETTTGEFKWDCKVVRPEIGENAAEFKLTATLTYKKVTDTKEFEGYVIPKTKEVTKYTNAKTMVTTAKKGDSVEFTGTVAGIAKQDGFFVTDGAGIVFVYMKGWKPGDAATSISGLSNGASVTVSGDIDLYYNTPQLVAVPTSVKVNTAGTSTYPTVTTVEKTITDLITYDFTNENGNGEFDSQVVSVVGQVKEGVLSDSSKDAKPVYLVDENGSCMYVYYKSDEAAKTAVEGLVGKLVKVDFVYVQVNTSYNDYGRYYGYVLNASAVSEQTFTDSKKQAFDKGSLTVLKETNMLGSLGLATTCANGSTVTWVSDKTDYITNDGNIVKLPDIGGDDVIVTLTATVTFAGLDSVTKEFTVTLKEPKIDTITEVLAMDASKKLTVTVEGVITAIAKNGYYLYDGSGYIFVKTTKNTKAAGTNVIAIGTYGKSYDEPIITQTTQKDSTKTLTVPAPEVVAIADIATVKAGDCTLYAHTVTITGTIEKVQPSGKTYYNYWIKDAQGNKLLLYFTTSVVDPAATYDSKVGQEVTINVVVASYNSSAAVGGWQVTDLTPKA